ncbi:hypothetical protein BV25DRAFT_1829653 [Artomyces pyxidatus]|uniref:Uncharacterized protein n=1 Tax=Artomyces pyxidatus TaxID=48021 RepID=A0ACB8SSQ8_9AGAM|nr:hypothetical protein BV25DRAFT_1829653 [Artomyces pyxidatus]
MVVFSADAGTFGLIVVPCTQFVWSSPKFSSRRLPPHTAFERTDMAQPICIFIRWDLARGILRPGSLELSG